MQALPAGHALLRRGRTQAWNSLYPSQKGACRMKILCSTMLLQLCICLIWAMLLCRAAAQADVFLWPKPRSIAWGSGLPIPLSSSFHFQLPARSPPELHYAAARYRRLIFTEKWVPVQVVPPSPAGLLMDSVNMRTSVDELPFLTVVIVDLDADLQQGVKEGYSLVVPDEGGSKALLKADTVWGAMHGLATFSQLVKYDVEAGNLVLPTGVTLSDAPLYGYRGILLDVARNFIPMADLKRTVRAMAYNKLNVLHLHLTDSQSFPLEVPSEPELARKGTFGSQFIYSVSDIQQLVFFARTYGIRIVPEIDIPGHSGSWAGAYPDIVTCYDKFWLPDMALEPAPGQLNPLKDETYRVAKNVIDYVASAFPDWLFHSGNDEIVSACWESSPDIAAYLKHNTNSLSTLLEVFVNATHPYVTSNNKTAIYWEDILLGYTASVSSSLVPPETTILETWNEGPLNTKRLTAAGYRTIVASSDFYYLDCGRGSFVGNDTLVDDQVNPSPGKISYNYGGNGGSWCAPYKTWQRIYDYDITYNLTDAEVRLVMGGEVSLWSEQVDETVLDGLLWPRASAIAETLWSGNRDEQGRRRSVDALNRLNDWRYRMVARGIKAAPLQPLWCLKHPGQCNSA